MEDLRTLFCGNLSPKVTEELLYELFLQAGPLEDVVLPKDSKGEQKSFAFIVFKHECSVEYAIRLFQHSALFERKLDLKFRERGGSTPRVPIQQPYLSPAPLPIFPQSLIPFAPLSHSFPPVRQIFNPTFQIFPNQLTPNHFNGGSPPASRQDRNRCNSIRVFKDDGSYFEDDRRKKNNEGVRDVRYQPYSRNHDQKSDYGRQESHRRQSGEGYQYREHDRHTPQRNHEDRHHHHRHHHHHHHRPRR